MEIPTRQTQHNLLDISDMLNGVVSAQMERFGHSYRQVRDKAMEEAHSKDSIYDLIGDYIKKFPYTNRRKDKKKPRLQFLFEDNHYPQQRISQGLQHPSNARNTKQTWNMNPGRLFIPKSVGDRMREIQNAPQSNAQQIQHIFESFCCQAKV